MDSDLKFSFNAMEANTIVKALMHLPYGEVVGVIHKLQKQANAQGAVQHPPQNEKPSGKGSGAKK